MKKAALHNLGCKVNAYETEAMQEILEKHGYEIVPFGEKADVYLINTSRDHYRIRIHLSGTMKHLSAFPVCNIGNCAGIYNINICGFIKWYNSITFFL